MGSKGKAGLDFSGKVVLITGAASGIGAATAEMFSKLGACLTLVDREEEDLAPQGVRVNAVNPGVIRTNLHKAGGMDEQSYADFLESSKQTHALGRIGEPTEVASVICFLASELASFVTGVTLPVDGGKQLMCPR
uniref:Protein FixR-like n=1 Tax=Drosophila rhopaloa TaxID=1041015 RepID=A0A6P4FFB9_DRORH